MQDATRLGVFGKIEMPGTVPRVWVKPLFYALTFEEKQNFLGAIWGYYLEVDPKVNYMRLFDDMTGKQVGSCNSSGLTMD